MKHQALTTYRALLDAAAQAPYAGWTEWVERPNVPGYERKDWDRRPCEDGSPAFVVVPTGDSSTMRLANSRLRLEQMAEKVRANWALFGGGPKPAEFRPKPRRARAWSGSMMSVWSAALDDGHQEDVLSIALQHLGGRVYQTEGRRAFLLLAPQPVEGLPVQLQSWRRDDGRYVVAEVNTGQAVDITGKTSRREAERAALVAWEAIAPDVRASRVAACAANCHVAGRTADPRAALEDWCAARGLADVPEYVPPVAADPAPEVPQPEPTQVQHQAPEPAEPLQVANPVPEPAPGAPVGAPVPDALTGAQVRRLMRVHRATIGGVATRMQLSCARVRHVRDRGLSGLPQVLDWLQGITGRPPTMHAGTWWHEQAGNPGPAPSLREPAPARPPAEPLTADPVASVAYPARPPAEPVTADPAASVPYPARPPAEQLTADPAASVAYAARPPREPLTADPAAPVPYPARPPAEPVTADPAASVAYAARPPAEPVTADPAASVAYAARPPAEPLTADPGAPMQHPRNTRPSTRSRHARPWPRAPRWPARTPTARTTRRSAARGQPIGSCWPTCCSPGRCPAPDRAQPRRLRCAVPGQPPPARRAGRHRPPVRPLGRAPPGCRGQCGTLPRVSRPVRTEKLQPLEVQAFPVEPA